MNVYGVKVKTNGIPAPKNRTVVTKLEFLENFCAVENRNIN